MLTPLEYSTLLSANYSYHLKLNAKVYVNVSVRKSMNEQITLNGLKNKKGLISTIINLFPTTDTVLNLWEKI